MAPGQSLWRVRRGAWVGAVVLSVVSPVAGGGLTLVEDGHPRATLVLGDRPDEVDRAAARDLQNYLRKMSGAELPVVEADSPPDSPPDGPAVLVGQSPAVRRLVGGLLDEKHLGPDGFILKTFPNRLVVVGHKAHPTEGPYHGTRYAAFALLEELGCRFFTPNADGEHVPVRKTVAVGELNIVSKADFIDRRPWNNGNIRPTLTEKTRRAWRQWMLKNRLGAVIEIYQGHAYDQWCSSDRYFKEHPEYFSYIRRKKQRIPMTAQEGQLCLSNPEVVKLAVAAARKRFDRGFARSFSLSPADTEEWCECERCLAMDDPDPAIGLATRVLRFNNQVAVEVSKTHPGRFFPYYAEYGNLPGPPVRTDGTVVLKAHPAVVPAIVMGKRFCVMHNVHDANCPKNVEYRRRLDAWLQVAQHLTFREWLEPGYRLSTPQTWIIGPRIRYYRDLGGLGYSGEILGRSPDNDLALYVAARMLWDADQDDKALIEEFFRLYYQEAAAPMERYYRELNRVGRRPDLHIWLLQFEAWTPKVFTKLIPYLDRARGVARQPIVKRRIERDRVALRAYQMFMRALDAHKQWQRDSTAAQQQAALRAVDEARDFLSTIADQDIVADTWLRDHWLGTMRKQLLSGKASQPVSARTVKGWSDEETFGDLWEEFEELVPVPEVWRFRLDPKNTGEAENWFAPDVMDTSWENIRIGEFWEMQGHPDYNGLAWYRLRLAIPEAARGRKLLLYFGAADESAHVWVNGVKAGHHDIGAQKGWKKRFAIDMTRLARPGEDNLIAVRVYDTMQMGGLWKSVKLVSPKANAERAGAGGAATAGRDMALDLGGGVKMEFVWVGTLNCWVGKYEVTNAQYRRFEPEHSSTTFTHTRTQEKLTLNGDRQPVVYVSYDQAVKFAGWLSRTGASRVPKGYRVRLPSGNEWMTFAQCGDADRKYPWGNDWPPPGDWNYHGSEGAAGGWSRIDGHNDGHPVSCAVEKSGKNNWGLYGVGGNVWEWTTDQSGASRVVRGVSWNYSNQNELRCASRHLNRPSDRSNVIGFRLLVARAHVRFEDVTSAMGLPVDGNEAAWIDYNNDGWTDLHAASALYRNEGGKRFVKTSRSIGGPPSWCDFDNDGYLDCFGAAGGGLAFGSAEGSFTTAELPSKPVGVSEGAMCVDMNGDGFVDIYWGGYEDWGKVAAYPDVIFTNQGDRTFKLTWTQESPLFPSRGIAAADFNNDGAADIYVSNYRLCGNILWRNDGTGRFAFASEEYGVLGGHGHSIGSAWGDLDNDGLIDLFAGNFAHAGQPQSRFLRNLGPARGYKFENRGTSGVTYQESYGSPALGDYDNDGDLDLLFTTVYGHNHAKLFSNDGDGRFSDVTAEAGLVGIPPTYMAAWGDFDNDGDLDLMTGGRLYRNTGTPNNWIKVKLQGAGRVNRAAIGAQVRIRLGDRTLTRQVESGAGNNTNDQTLHFGLGKHTGEVELEVSWPYVKARQTSTAAVNSRVTVVCAVGDEPAGTTPAPEAKVE